MDQVVSINGKYVLCRNVEEIELGCEAIDVDGVEPHRPPESFAFDDGVDAARFDVACNGRDGFPEPVGHLRRWFQVAKFLHMANIHETDDLANGKPIAACRPCLPGTTAM